MLTDDWSSKMLQENDMEVPRARKSRNQSEKKRRDHFNVLINELHSLVCKSGRKMDKTTVLKAAMVYLRNHNEASRLTQQHEIKENWKPEFLSNEEFTQIMLESLDSFVLVITQAGTVVYASDSIMQLLNHAPNSVRNHNFYDLVHPTERVVVRGALQDKLYISLYGSDNDLAFECHMRRGCYSGPPDCEYYDRVHLSGFLTRLGGMLGRDANVAAAPASVPGSGGDHVCFCCTARLLTTPLMKEVSAAGADTAHEFTSRHNMEWKFLFLDYRGPPIIGYLPFELLGTSGYDYYHPDDLDIVSRCHIQLMDTGEGTSCVYRFLTKGQQWVWLQTHYYITYHQWTSKPEFVVCTNTVATHEQVVAARVPPEEEEPPGEQDLPEKGCAEVSSPEVTGSITRMDHEEEAATTAAVATEKAAYRQPAPSPQPATFVEAKREQPSPGEVVLKHAPHMDTDLTVYTPQGDDVTERPGTPQKLVLTGVERQLAHQLHEKHRKLQESIRQQQQELHSIWGQLMLTQRLCMPIEDTPICPTSPEPTISETPTFSTVPSIIEVSTDLPIISAVPRSTCLSVICDTPIPSFNSLSNLDENMSALSSPDGNIFALPPGQNHNIATLSTPEAYISTLANLDGNMSALSSPDGNTMTATFSMEENSASSGELNLFPIAFYPDSAQVVYLQGPSPPLGLSSSSATLSVEGQLPPDPDSELYLSPGGTSAVTPGDFISHLPQ